MSRRQHRHRGCRVPAAAVATVLLVAASGSAVAAPAPARQDRRPTGDPRFVVGPNLRASANASGGNRNESWIATNPRNPDFVIGVSQIGPTGAPLECTTMLSRNGGRTWRETRLPGQETGCFDPMVLATRDGRIYVLHAMMLQRNLLSTAVTRARKLVVLVGSRRALGMAVANADQAQRESALTERLQSPESP